MKCIVLIVLFLPSAIYSQVSNFYFDFDNTTPQNGQLYIDTISNPNNIWQIGSTNKIGFATNCNSISIVTDTLNPYPISDTSSFVIWHIAEQGLVYNTYSAQLEFVFYSQTDSLNDSMKIEFSPDNGISWVLISQDTTNFISGGMNQTWPMVSYANHSGEPNFSGNSNGCESLIIDLKQANEIFSMSIGDTVKFRFTFISDPLFDNLSGIRLDELTFQDGVSLWSINEIELDNIKVYPNPTNERIILFSNLNQELFNVANIYSMSGEFVKQALIDSEGGIDVSGLNDSEYLFVVFDFSDAIIGKGRFLVQK